MAAVRCTIAAALIGQAWGLVPPPSTQARHTALQAKRPDYIPGVISDPGYVRIFDTTLRDGEQSPGATLTSNEKLDIARMLAKLGVDIIEAGFPIASPDDFDAVNQIARVVGNEVDADGYVPVICGLSRANPKDIERAWEAVKPAQRPRVHTFIATSPIHMETKLKKTPEEVLQIAVDAVKFAKSLGCDDIEFSPEDAGRSDPEFLIKVLSAVVDAGATHERDRVARSRTKCPRVRLGRFRAPRLPAASRAPRRARAVACEHGATRPPSLGVLRRSRWRAAR